MYGDQIRLEKKAPLKNWEYLNFDVNKMVEDYPGCLQLIQLPKLKMNNICSGVNIDGNLPNEISDMLGVYELDNGVFRYGRQVFKNTKSGHYLRVHGDYWVLCQNLQCSGPSLVTAGGSNNMRPNDPLDVVRNERLPDMKMGWRYYDAETRNWKTYKLSLKC